MHDIQENLWETSVFFVYSHYSGLISPVQSPFRIGMDSSHKVIGCKVINSFV